MGVMNRVEVESHYAIELEEYSNKIQVGGAFLGNFFQNHIIPIYNQDTLIKMGIRLSFMESNLLRNFHSKNISCCSVNPHIGVQLRIIMYDLSCFFYFLNLFFLLGFNG